MTIDDLIREKTIDRIVSDMGGDKDIAQTCYLYILEKINDDPDWLSSKEEYIEWYIIKMASNFLTKSEVASRRLIELPDSYDPTSLEGCISDRLDDMYKLDDILDELDLEKETSIGWYHKRIFWLYLQSKSLRTLSEELSVEGNTISYQSLWVTIKEVRAQLRELHEDTNNIR